MEQNDISTYNRTVEIPRKHNEERAFRVVDTYWRQDGKQRVTDRGNLCKWMSEREQVIMKRQNSRRATDDSHNFPFSEMQKKKKR